MHTHSHAHAHTHARVRTHVHTHIRARARWHQKDYLPLSVPLKWCTGTRWGTAWLSRSVCGREQKVPWWCSCLAAFLRSSGPRCARSGRPTGPVWEHVHGHTLVLNVPLDQSENTYMDIPSFWISHWTSLRTCTWTYGHTHVLNVPLDRSENTYMDIHTFWMSHWTSLRTRTWTYTRSECPTGPVWEHEHGHMDIHTFWMSHWTSLRTRTWTYGHTHVLNDPLDQSENTYMDKYTFWMSHCTSLRTRAWTNTRSECLTGLVWKHVHGQIHVLNVPLDLSENTCMDKTLVHILNVP